MQLSSKKQKQDDLSILIHKDGFSFCTSEQHHLFKLEDNPPTEESLNSWLKYHHLNQPNQKLIFLDQPAITVPLPLFEESLAHQYLNSAQLKNNELHATFNKLVDLEQVIVFNVNTQWSELFKKILPNAKHSHLVSELLPALSNYSTGKAKRNLFIHLRKGAFDLFLYQGGQLLLQNSFPHLHADDFLYYLFYVTEQFYLKPEQFNLFFLGKYNQYDDYYAGVKEFHDSIDFFDPQFSIIDHQHPVPFFQTFSAE